MTAQSKSNRFRCLVGVLTVEHLQKVPLFCTYLDIQIHISQNFLAWFLPTRSQQAVFYWKTLAIKNYRFQFSVGVLILGKCQELLNFLTVLDIQVHNCSTLRGSLLLQRFHFDNFLLVGVLSKISHRFFLSVRMPTGRKCKKCFHYKSRFLNSECSRTSILASSMKNSIGSSSLEEGLSIEE